MGRVAFVFSGQGDQHPGMGLNVSTRYDAASDVFARCDALHPGTSEMCFSGTAEALCETKNTQPCLFAVEMAMAEALKRCGLTPDAVAGFSLGELAALTFAGAMDLESGFKLVCKRGELMQADAENHPAAMAAVLRLTPDQVEALCEQHEEIYPVNYNCPGQISVSGLAEHMQAFYQDVKQAGGRTIPLKVSGGFHSPFMKSAGEAFSGELEKADLRAPEIPVYSDVTGQIYSGDVADTLSRQICSPVRWETIIRNMIEDGVNVFVEIGPGKTLCNLISRIDAGVRTFAASAYEDLEALCEEVRAC